ncbi:MAG: hypothetical protein LBP22_03630 [Deltaproteobacteria bacterium]|jgi:hypothetical protein|nr:hypothetical protein [Deltaproteobacteria bacterium]
MNTVDIGTEYSSTALLFQAGCLTVDLVLNTAAGDKFCLCFPNPEIQAAVASLWLFLKKPLENPLLMKMQAQAMLAALIQRQADEFQTAFQSFLSSIPWEDHSKSEACCKTLFLTATVMAGRECDCQYPAGSGRLDARLRTGDGNDYVIELKFVKVTVKDKEGKDKDLTDGQIQEDMEKTLTAAMTQMEGNK